MMCAYCNEEKDKTKEHIISSAVLKLFPDSFLTHDERRGNLYEDEPVISDVCSECNNHKLSYIDSYASNIIKKYFVQKYSIEEDVLFEYDYTMLQKMLMKYAFNDLRSIKEDTSFYKPNIINFLLNSDDNEPVKHVSILAGLAIEVGGLPSELFGSKEIQWGTRAHFIKERILTDFDFKTTRMETQFENIKLENLSFSYVFRFNSIQFILLCWDPNITTACFDSTNAQLETLYPYNLLSQKNKTILKR